LLKELAQVTLAPAIGLPVTELTNRPEINPWVDWEKPTAAKRKSGAAAGNLRKKRGLATRAQDAILPHKQSQSITVRVPP
jgi:hypothetical protein